MSKGQTGDILRRRPAKSPRTKDRPLNVSATESAAPDAAVGAANAPIDADLQVILDRWSDLSDSVKSSILAMVLATGG